MAKAAQATADQRLKKIIDATLGDGNIDTRKSAAAIITKHSTLTQDWLLDQVELLVRARRKLARRMARMNGNPYMDFLPGFASLEQKLPLGNGTSAVVKGMMIPQLEKRLALIREKFESRGEAAFLIDLIPKMKALSPTYKRLNVERYGELRAAGIEPPVVTLEKVETAVGR